MGLITEKLPVTGERHLLPVAGDLGNMQVRLANDPADLQAIQALRHEVFNPSGPAKPGAGTKFDQDKFDRYCDHLMVTDASIRNQKSLRGIVGTYRLLRQEVANSHCGYYSASEFDLAPMMKRHSKKNFLELGRSCVRDTHRSKRTIELLWHGTWSYILHHKIDVLFGCASFPGVDPTKYSDAFAYLHRFHLARNDWMVNAKTHGFHRLATFASAASEMKSAMRQMPPLIKGYLRLGAQVGPHAVVDHDFGTTDIFIILPVSQISPKYIAYYGANAERHRAT